MFAKITGKRKNKLTPKSVVDSISQEMEMQSESVVVQAPDLKETMQQIIVRACLTILQVQELSPNKLDVKVGDWMATFSIPKPARNITANNPRQPRSPPTVRRQKSLPARSRKSIPSSTLTNVKRSASVRTSRIPSIDISAVVAEFQQKLVGLRLQNVYDVTAKIFLLKFAKPDVKEMVLLESGFRLHLTSFVRDKEGYPSGFCMKLRKHLRTKRLNAVRQLGIDRIVDFEFGFAEGAYHILAEFYASGNIILTDAEYRIIALLRVVSPEENVKFAVGEIYPFQVAQPFEPLTIARLQAVLDTAGPKDNLKKFLGNKLGLSAVIIEHCLVLAGIDATTKCAVYKDEDKLDILYQALLHGDEIMKSAMTLRSKGYITMLSTSSDSTQKALMYHEFHPYLFEQFKTGQWKAFDTFNLAVDEFFGAIETQKVDSKAQAREEFVQKKLETVRKEHTGRIEALGVSLVSNERKAQLLEANLERVDQALLVIRSAIASGMDWVDLGVMVEEEKAKQNPVALLITSLKLETNQVILKLSEPDYGFDDDSDESIDDQDTDLKPQDIEIDISLSAYSNARKYYDMKKVSARKQEKTIQTASKAIKSAEAKIMRDVKAAPVLPTINKFRKQFWFEKFIWFISNENYLVLGGRDAQQNELLVKRHFRKGDVYIHADLPGSASVIIKNPSGDVISPNTLSQAGCMAICNSRAWDAKIVTSAYWVEFDQVSKSAPSGEYLTTGSFMIRGKKNFLPPTQLVYGIGLMFRLADESISAHLYDRRPELRGNADGESVQDIPVVQTILDPENKDADDEAILPKRKEPSAQPRRLSVTSAAPSSFEIAADKYQLDDITQPVAEIGSAVMEEIVNSSSAIVNPNKYVTAKERRQQKKPQGSAGVFTTQSEDVKEEFTVSKETSPEKPEQSKPIKLPRGKKSKLKKMNTNYRHQDDEERALRMQLLGSAGIPRAEVKKAAEKAQNANPLNPGDADRAKERLSHLNLAPAKIDDSPNSIDATEQDEVKLMMEEENVPADEREDVEDLSYLDSLTGTPLDNDILLFAVPVCAPYTALQNYKYKLKLLPGTLKKGKAAKSVQNAFMTGTSDEKEKDLIKSVPEQDYITAILARVKIMNAANEAGKKGGRGGRKK